MSVVGKLETVESTIHWKIENFSSVDATLGKPTHSPVFQTTHCTQKIQWQLELYPGGFNGEHREYMGLYLRNLSKFEVSISFTLSVLDKKYKEIATFVLSKARTFDENRCSGKHKLVLQSVVRDKTKEVLTNDTLLLTCSIRITSSNNEQYNEDENEHDTAKAHYESLMKNGDMSDVTIEFENKQMRLHKAIITSISPVFLAMFQHPMKEKEECVVKITDVKYEVMEELFRYIYVRKVNDIESIAGYLLVAADKYAVRGLKLECERTIYKKVNNDNALQYLEFAIKYNTTFLKSKVTEYVTSRLSKFVHTPEFERVDASCKDELLRAVAKKFKDK